MKAIALFITFLLWTGCSASSDSGPVEPDKNVDQDQTIAGTAPPVPEQPREGELAELPDSCDVFTLADAAQVLGGPAERYEPRVECAYLEQGVGKAKGKQIGAAVYSPALQDRPHEGLPEEQLIEQLRLDMLGAELIRTEPGIGRGGYVFKQRNGVVVWAWTGLRYRDKQGRSGEAAVQTNTMKYGDDPAGVEAAVTAARIMVEKLKAGG